MQKKYVAIIFARGNSKGLPGKNLKQLCGKPLIAWSIIHARNVKRIKRVIVSTDSEDIASVALQYGAEIPFKRPNELATDDSPEWLSWRHAINYLKENEGELPDAIISIPATSPLRASEDIDRCLDKFEEGLYDAVVTISNASRNPFFNMVKIEMDNSLSLVLGNNLVSRRQDAPVVYDLATVAYVIKPKYVLENDHLFEGYVGGVLIPKNRSLDIDNLLDFKIAEFLMKESIYNES